MKTAAEQYEQDRETFEEAEFEYVEARTVWTRDTQDGHYCVEIEWMDDSYNVQAIPYNPTRSIPDLDKDTATAEEAIKIADAFAPGRTFNEFDRDDTGAPHHDVEGLAQHVTRLKAVINSLADVLEAHAVHGDHTSEALQHWAQHGRTALGNIPDRAGKYDGVEISTVLVFEDGQGGEYCEAMATVEEYLHSIAGGEVRKTMFSVYAHLTAGGVECMADCDTPQLARVMGMALSNFWGVEIVDQIILTAPRTGPAVTNESTAAAR